MLTDWYDEAEVEEFLAGLEDVQQRAREYGAASFMDLDSDRQIEILTQMEKEVEEWRENGEPGATPFFQTIKSLTLFGYYTSEVGGDARIACKSDGSL